MGHPPVNTSDLSLVQFLHDIQDHNNNNQLKKGVKLDFKSIDAFESALDSLQSLWDSVSIHLNFVSWYTYCDLYSFR